MRTQKHGTATRLMTAIVIALGGFLIAAGGAASAQEEGTGGWQRVDPARIQDNPVKLFGHDWLALAAGTAGDMNAMTIGWGGLGTLWGMDNAVVTVYVEPSRHTHGYMERNDYFTVTAFPEQYRDALKYIGSRSGRDEDKIANAGLSVAFTELGNPLFNEGRLVLECRKIYTAPLDMDGMGERGKQLYGPGSRMKPHTMFIGEVVNAWVK